MGIDAVGAALRSVASTPVSPDPIEQIKASAAVRVLKKVLDVQADLTATLLASGHIGRHLDVRA